MSNNILIKPLITEKSTKLVDKRNQYTFVVDRGANKIEIKKAVEAHYGVTVDTVNTVVVPRKQKTLFRKGRQIPGTVAGYKKAIVTLPMGELISFYGSEE